MKRIKDDSRTIKTMDTIKRLIIDLKEENALYIIYELEYRNAQQRNDPLTQEYNIVCKIQISNIISIQDMIYNEIRKAIRTIRIQAA